jgi:hypothetical protein
MTKDILAGIFSGEIAYWNDSRIQKANAESKKYLPYQKINVVVRDAASDTTGILLSYLTNTSSDFKAVFQHFKSMGDAGYRNMDFGSLIASDRLFFASSNERVDSMVTAVDGTLGYYLQNSAPNAFVAAFCSNSSCAAGGITYPGYDSGASLTACEARSAPVAVFDVAHDIRTYDLKHSKAKGCYPIAGTVDYTVYKKDLTGSSTLCSLSSNRTEHQRIVTEGLRFGSWLYNGSDVVSGLTSAAPVAASCLATPTAAIATVPILLATISNAQRIVFLVCKCAESRTSSLRPTIVVLRTTLHWCLPRRRWWSVRMSCRPLRQE